MACIMEALLYHQSIIIHCHGFCISTETSGDTTYIDAKEVILTCGLRLPTTA